MAAVKIRIFDTKTLIYLLVNYNEAFLLDEASGLRMGPSCFQDMIQSAEFLTGKKIDACSYGQDAGRHQILECLNEARRLLKEQNPVFQQLAATASTNRQLGRLKENFNHAARIHLDIAHQQREQEGCDPKKGAIFYNVARKLIAAECDQLLSDFVESQKETYSLSDKVNIAGKTPDLLHGMSLAGQELVIMLARSIRDGYAEIPPLRHWF